MHLENVSAENFRNLNGRIECAGGLNIIHGENGIGKTNWLEAIYLLSSAKSFRTARLTEAVRFGESLAIVRGNVRRSEEIVRTLQVTINGNTKQLTVNDKKETSARYMTELNSILFNSEQLEIVRGTPAARRTFLDDGIVAIFPPYIQTLADYRQVVKQKNSLLQTARDKEYKLDALAALLEPWNDQLVALAGVINKARQRYVERLGRCLATSLFEREQLSIRYASSLEGKGDMSDYNALLRERLALRLEAELYNGRALIGPHRDELEIAFDGRDIRKFGSSGQQRSALLLLLLAQLTVYFEQNNEYPLVLLDDIDAELDYARIGKLLEYLENKSQTFVTTSKESFIERFGANKNRIGLSRQVEIQSPS
ncbi:MAG: DNA replication and repair protein RecF [Pyrinomonadaceae bacterium]